jgi:hypothetical protein
LLALLLVMLSFSLAFRFSFPLQMPKLNGIADAIAALAIIIEQVRVIEQATTALAQDLIAKVAHYTNSQGLTTPATLSRNE